MTLSAPARGSLLSDSWARLLVERAESRATWLIVPRDPVRSDDALRHSYTDLYRNAQIMGAGLLRTGAESGDRIMVALDNSPDFCFVFFGALLAGLVPVPFPPRYTLAGAAYGARMETIRQHCSAHRIVVDADSAERLRRDVPSSLSFVTPEELRGHGDARTLPAPQAQSSLALIQYTSGTTGPARGVELSHTNLLLNAHSMLDAVGGVTPEEVACSWLPMFHDMGLIGMMLLTIYAGIPLVLLKPRQFILRPESWLWAMSRFRATASAAPNFAYQLCGSRIRDEKLPGLDLSAWRLALNGSEAVEVASLLGFQERFAPFGFRSHAMTPVYGLAENTLGTCFSPYQGEPGFEVVSQRALQVHGRAVPAERDSAETRRAVVSVGTPLAGQRVRIVDQSGRELEERMIGQIQVSGPCVMRGYHRDAEATRAVIHHDGFLSTGDRGYCASGALYVVGRIKETIKHAGQQLDAADICDAVRAATKSAVAVACFGMPNMAKGTEDVIILVEARSELDEERRALRRAAGTAVQARIGFYPDSIEVVRPGTIPRTTSGKVSHQAARNRYTRRASW
jgi:acyl-CoA synthetase (AMP-forming)/AMP-acid ligase II